MRVRHAAKYLRCSTDRDVVLAALSSLDDVAGTGHGNIGRRLSNSMLSACARVSLPERAIALLHAMSYDRDVPPPDSLLGPGELAAAMAPAAAPAVASAT